MTLEITEKQFSEQVEQLLNLFQWRWCHFRPARTLHGWRTPLSGHKGLPDYIAVKGKRFLIFELKSAKGKVWRYQQGWLTALGKVPGIEVYLWRPDDLGSEILEVLRNER